jgi:hypothetical protein
VDKSFLHLTFGLNKKTGKMKYLFVTLSFISISAFAQSSEALAINSEGTKIEMPVAAKEVVIQLKNNAGIRVALYAGDKKQVFDGKLKEVGGKSSNTLYLKVGDAVCIMNDPKTIQACSIIKEEMTGIEINTSGNGFIK